jgi:glycosyltransferase involved in cell wall biosynthesis
MTIKKRILIGLNSSWNLFNFRSGLIRALVLDGHEVIAAAPQDEYSDRIPALGCQYLPLAMDAKSKNPIKELLLLIRFLRLFKTTQPDIFLGYTIKPNIYGSLAARLCGVKVINNIAGLGISFQSRTIFTRFLEWLYRLALSSSNQVFFQNEDDLSQFVRLALVHPDITDQLPGSGVDLIRFPATPLPLCESSRPFRFLVISRMLWSKGIGEFVEAARRLKTQHFDVEFCLLGFLDVQNPDAISRAQMDEWVMEGSINYLGSTDNVRNEIAAADCVVLPSYYPEGIPRSLLESAAIGRPIITTDTIGCREVVKPGVNGFLCQPRDTDDLAHKLEQILSLTYQQLSEMGQASRHLAEVKFDEQIVIRRYLKAINSI